MKHDVDIYVTGVPRGAVFYVETNQVEPEEHARLLTPQEIQAFFMPLELEYTYRAIRFIRTPTIADNHSDPVHALSESEKARVVRFGTIPENSEESMGLYFLKRIDKGVEASKFPIWRSTSPETRAVQVHGLRLPEIVYTETLGCQPKSTRTLVYWQRRYDSFEGHWHKKKEESNTLATIQIGLRNKWNDPNTMDSYGSIRPSGEVVDIVVANIDEFSSAYRVRRSLSYEAIAVDLLHELRGDSETRNPGTAMKRIFPDINPKTPDLKSRVLVLRISNAAVFVYCYGATVQEEGGEQKEKIIPRESAHLLFHHDECAPLSQPELGQMHGYSGFVGPHIAVAIDRYCAALGEGASSFSDVKLTIVDAVKRGLAWQHVCFQRGLWFMFNKTGSKDPCPFTTDLCKTNGYERLFRDIALTLYEPKPPVTNESDALKKLESDNTCVSDDKLGDILKVEVAILPAIAHRRQWFMAYSRKETDPRDPDTNHQASPTPKSLEDEFRKEVVEWIAGDPIKQPKDSDIPIAKIGDAWLADRREVEDYLSLHQVLRVYESSKESRPLNLAVFGAPGSGKSFAVKEIVKHISGSSEDKFQKEALTFNLGEFKSIDDLPGALNLVRNRCLDPGLPIVFFDEFDSAFQGQAFGWLKYFLAPMQDGTYYHNGQSYRLGRAVFVFAGGVNRSFEELNGRLRNPGFCEAKGPDFISRLKAHLNILGINKQEDDSDQGRFVLRRGILLRAILMKRFQLKPDSKVKQQLVTKEVANALLKVPAFRHGVRSLETIVNICSISHGSPIGPSDLPSMEQLDMHVDAARLLTLLGKDEE